jgi:uncharacterized membrane protein (DUF2068 family)
MLPTNARPDRPSTTPDDPGKTHDSRRVMRFVAAMEALKAVIVIGAGFGLLSLLHRDVRQVAVGLVTRMHLDPDGRYPGLFLDTAERLTDARLWGLAALALLYAAIRLTEGYGLWFERRWAAWLGAGSGGIYVPIEIYELWHKPGPLKAATLALNIAVVAYLLWSLRRPRAAT